MVSWVVHGKRQNVFGFRFGLGGGGFWIVVLVCEARCVDNSDSPHSLYYSWINAVLKDQGEVSYVGHFANMGWLMLWVNGLKVKV